MVKCSRCGVDIKDDWSICPNCGNDLTRKEDMPESQSSNDGNICGNCGAELKEGATFCQKCGNKIESVEDTPRCSACGSEIPENVLFCPTCGAKVESKPQKVERRCPNCGFELEEGTTFCPECGSNVFTGEKTVGNQQNPSGFLEKINLNAIVVPTILSLAVAIILSLIGLLIGFTWFSFILAIIISVGFFAGTINNEANAIVSGAITGLILGFLENPLVEFLYGGLAAVFYDWLYGGQILLLIILGIIMAYVSNMFLKDNIRGIVEKLGISWL